MSLRIGAALLALSLPLLVPSAVWANGNAETGEAIFKAKCAICHSLEAGQNRVGPTLAAVVGRKAGVVQGFNYSDAMSSSGLRWNAAALDKWLANPSALVPGTHMAFPGLKGPQDRADVIEYLKKRK